MGKPADKLHKLAMSPHTTMDEAETLKHCKRLLDECERLLRNSVEALLHGSPKARIEAARQASVTLAKLRGEQ